jgi:hypothetical protein
MSSKPQRERFEALFLPIAKGQATTATVDLIESTVFRTDFTGKYKDSRTLYAWLTFQAAEAAALERAAQICDEQADFNERLNPKNGRGSYMGKLAVSRQRDCAKLIRKSAAPVEREGE